MTEVSTHLFYGLFVRTSSLLIASEAFIKIQPCFLAIDLILSRQKKNKLLTSTSNELFSAPTITLVPTEIWNMIKDELIGIQLKESEKELVFKFKCDCCRGICESKSCRCKPWRYEIRETPIIAWNAMIEDECTHCDSIQTDILGYGNVWSDKSGFKLKVVQFLKSFRLEIIGSGNVGDWDYDSEPLIPVGNYKNFRQECHHFEEATPFHAITSLSPSDFELPFSVEFISRQFKLLQKLYGIEVSDYKEKIENSQKPQGIPRVKVVDKDVDSKAVERWREPSWTLWTEGENEW